ncbi:MAG: UDP-N-acetylmuramate--L-alanine ligase [Candidatus Berkelbacteria bacterium]|nr:MAG: UDP-N-acetylmuramate--L-alanine ligase [Candidatus Berkelbacteria bacterium]QQG51487.1 MAG: UDP-N-acetylmuramate--L-alanine ligase [Candidatus Berkelbacteria bacterium]
MARKNKVPHRYYFIGIRGVAMSGLAVMMKSLGYEVAGSDDSGSYADEATERRFAELGIEPKIGFDQANIKQFKPDIVVISAAFGVQNPEYKAAKSGRITILTHSEALGKVIEKFEGVGVAGVHGKTTTTSLLAYILKEAGFSPSYAIGAPDVRDLEGNAHIGDGKYFVVEADEYKKSEQDKTPRFMDLPLKHVIITSIELDHPDVYESAEDVYKAFYDLSIKIPRDGTIVACIDSPLVRRLASRRVDLKSLTYGFGSQAQFQIIDHDESGEATSFSIKNGEKKLGPFTLKLPGAHNVLNATGAIVMSLRLGVSEQAVVRAVGSFSGPARRFEKMGQYNGASIYQDYAHHPTALDYLIATVRSKFPTKKLTLVFQPHTYSRTGKLLKEFASSLAKADRLILLNIFASAREKSGYVTIKDLVEEVRKLKKETEYRSSLEEAATYLGGSIDSNDVVFLVGAGDVYKIYEKLQNLREH